MHQLQLGGLVGFILHIVVIAKGTEHNSTKAARVFAAMFAIVGFVITILLGLLSAFLFVTNGYVLLVFIVAE